MGKFSPETSQSFAWNMKNMRVSCNVSLKPTNWKTQNLHNHLWLRLSEVVPAPLRIPSLVSSVAWQKIADWASREVSWDLQWKYHPLCICTSFSHDSFMVFIYVFVCFHQFRGSWNPTWLAVRNIFIFPHIGNNHPNWLSYFSEGWGNHQPDTLTMFHLASGPWRIISTEEVAGQRVRLAMHGTQWLQWLCECVGHESIECSNKSRLITYVERIYIIYT